MSQSLFTCRLDLLVQKQHLFSLALGIVTCGCVLLGSVATAESAPLFGKKGQAETTMLVVITQMRNDNPAAQSAAGVSQTALSPQGASMVSRSAGPAAAVAPSPVARGTSVVVPERASVASVAPFTVDIPASAIPRQTRGGVESKDTLQGFSRGAFVQQGELPGSQKRQNAAGAAKALQATSGQEYSSRPDTAAANQGGHTPHTMISDERLKVTGSMSHHPDSRFTVQHTPLPGARHTRSSEEYGNAPEMTMSYKLNNSSSARVALNPQDQTSPLYSPIVKENGLAATGVYLDVDVKDDLQLQLGGEVRSHDNDSLSSSQDETAAGASIGLRWNF